MQSKKETWLIFSLLFVSVLSFFSFGFFHLGKFETTDEHLWKYDRIGQYWSAIKDKNWEKTYINDKPGVTVALISGIGLIFEPKPEINENILGDNPENNKLFEQYNYRQSEITNFRFRLPILIFATLSLLAFFYLMFRAFNSYWTALLATILIATNPILLGISQIINPDSFFWIFGGLSMISYLALLNTKEKKFLILCGILTGFALLSKYTAFILFIFFIIAALGKIIFQKEEDALKMDWKIIVKHISQIIIIFLISIIIFSIFLPAVFAKPQYLFKGISQFLNLETIFSGIGLVALLAVLIAFQKNIIGRITQKISRQKNIILSIFVLLFSALIVVSLVNVWTGQKISPVSELRDLSYANEPTEFSFKSLLNRKDGSFTNAPKLFLMEAYPFIFSIPPLLILLVFFVAIQSLRKKISENNYFIFFPISFFILIYFLSTLFAHVVANVRYSIILYPLLAVWGAIAIKELADFFNPKTSKKILLISTLVLLVGIFSLWTIKPFYFSYTNFLLPQKYTIHDSWGHGSYEAAQYLNSFSGAKDLIIWSNSDTVCRFFQGKCLRSRKIDLNKAVPDYFVISKRGELKLSNRFLLINPPDPEKNSDYYFNKLESDYVWQILIDGRPGNFIKVIKYEK